SSWAASETNERWADTARSKRSSIEFMVRAKRWISSAVAASGTRLRRFVVESSATSERIASTTPSVLLTGHHAMAPTRTTSAGPRTAKRASSVWIVSLTGSTEVAAKIVMGPDGVLTLEAATRYSAAASTIGGWRRVRTSTAPGRG